MITSHHPEQLRDSLWSNALSSTVGLVIFIIFVIYMLSTNGGSTTALMGFMMAMANTYGLVIVIALMGNGLVALPRRIWEIGNTSHELVRLYMLVRISVLVCLSVLDRQNRYSKLVLSSVDKRRYLTVTAGV